MHVLELKEAQSRLSELLREAAVGKEVGIRHTDGVVFRLVLMEDPPRRPRYGSARDAIEISDDFEEPLDDFETYES